MNVAEAIQTGADLLRERSIPEPNREAIALLQYVLKFDATFLRAHPEHRLSAMESVLFKAVIKRRSLHEPFQHIVGIKEFYGLEFAVTPDVLIPRPETEILVESAIAQFRDAGSVSFCEIGVGSGCISISLLANLSFAKATGVDISDAAIAISSQNAEKHHVSERLRLIKANLFEGIGNENFDLIVSNPPYIPSQEIAGLQEEVRSYEPHLALDGGKDGLDVIRRLVEKSPNYLQTDGFLLIEIGFGQAASVSRLLKAAVWQDTEFLPDLQGIPRILRARLR